MTAAATLAGDYRAAKLDQADRLRALVRDLSPEAPAATARRSAAAPAHTIAIASGKGGVGKTNIAVNLALALAQEGWNTTILDGDLSLGNADLVLGLTPRLHLGHVLDGRRSIDDVIVSVAPRLRLVPGASGVARLADLDRTTAGRLLSILRTIENTSQVLIIDCGAGIGAGVLSLVGSADAAVVVTTPEPTSIADGYALIKCAASLGATENATSSRIGLVVNEARSCEEGRAVHARIAGVCERFLRLPLPLLGIVPFDDRIAQAVRDRRPVVAGQPRSAGARAIRDLSASVREFAGLVSNDSALERGLVRRLLGRLRVTL